ncbi:30S ribosomal protein S17 [Thermofilum sp.]|jgi:small subunit ribosomal protein S17|uniref:30S ribosomal protein S17 n=1 Tax=Thermofilum sp. TaxID=1961369 RepID=UPI00258CCB3F|nr:30S ribosomal protein S17 [Thermofilum sp.]
MAKKKGVGIPGVQPPQNKCDDPLCPWHGQLPVRGQVLRLRIEKMRMQNVAVAVHEYLHYNEKYKRYEVRRKKKHVRVPLCISVKPGDEVIVAETRPLAKSVSFVVIGKA